MPFGWAVVDADELGAAAEIDLDQLPRVGELALRVVGLRQPHPRAGGGKPDHRAGIGDVRGDDRAVGQDDVGQEALVAAHEGGGNQRGGQAHGQPNNPSGRRMERLRPGRGCPYDRPLAARERRQLREKVMKIWWLAARADRRGVRRRRHAGRRRSGAAGARSDWKAGARRRSRCRPSPSALYVVKGPDGHLRGRRGRSRRRDGETARRRGSSTCRIWRPARSPMRRQPACGTSPSCRTTPSAPNSSTSARPITCCRAPTSWRRARR